MRSFLSLLDAETWLGLKRETGEREKGEEDALACMLGNESVVFLFFFCSVGQRVIDGIMHRDTTLFIGPERLDHLFFF